MNDFLANLAYRNLHPDQTLQPRLLSRFETAQPASFGLGEPGEMDTPDQFRESRIEEVAGRVSAMASPSPAIAPAATGELKAPKNGEPATRQSEFEETADQTPAAPSRVMPAMIESKSEGRRPFDAVGEAREESLLNPARESVARLLPPIITSTAAPTTITTGRGIAEDELESLAARVARIERDARRGEAAGRANEPIRAPRQVRSKVDSAIPPELKSPVTKEPLMTAPAPERPIAPRLPPAPAADLAEEKEPPAPVIHVSIGRVEVRAALPQPKRAVPKAPAKNPPMSLEEYLKRGGR